MKLIRVAALLWLMHLPAVAAEQSSYVFPTTAPPTGPRDLGSIIGTYINPGIRALASCSNGPTAPANGPSSAALLGQCWFDTSASPSIALKYWDGAAWATLGTLNASTHAWAVGAPALAATIRGNPTASTAAAADFTINSLTARGAPDSTGDYLIIWDHVSGTLKKITPADVAATATGVASIASYTGAFTLGPGLTNSTTTLSIDKATASNYYAGTSNKVPTTDVIYPSSVTVTYGTTTTFDMSTFINAQVTLTGNITTQTLSNVVAGKAGVIVFIQDGTGSRTTVWNSIFKWAGGTAPTLSTTANAADWLLFNCITTTNCAASLMKDVR